MEERDSLSFILQDKWHKQYIIFVQKSFCGQINSPFQSQHGTVESNENTSTSKHFLRQIHENRGEISTNAPIHIQSPLNQMRKRIYGFRPWMKISQTMFYWSIPSKLLKLIHGNYEILVKWHKGNETDNGTHMQNSYHGAEQLMVNHSDKGDINEGHIIDVYARELECMCKRT